MNIILYINIKIFNILILILGTRIATATIILIVCARECSLDINISRLASVHHPETLDRVTLIP